MLMHVKFALLDSTIAISNGQARGSVVAKLNFLALKGLAYYSLGLRLGLIIAGIIDVRGPPVRGIPRRGLQNTL